MSEIEVEGPSKMRKGESGSIKIRLPETDSVKTIEIGASLGTILPSGRTIKVSREADQIDVPLVVTQEAPDTIEVSVGLVTEKGTTKLKKTKTFEVEK